MIQGILIGIIAITLIGLWFYRKKTSTENTGNIPATPTMADKSTPSPIIGFGYKCMWFAVKTRDRYKVAEILSVKNLSDCNWLTGIDRAYKGSVYITPAIDEWTLACGWGLPYGDNKAGIEEVKGYLQVLSKEFGEAQYFTTHRVTEYHCWIKAIDGQIERVYSYSGESGENIAVEGAATSFEQTINLANTFSSEAKDSNYHDRQDIIWANEELVMQIAGHWSLNPTRLDERTDISNALGLLGER